MFEISVSASWCSEYSQKGTGNQEAKPAIDKRPGLFDAAKVRRRGSEARRLLRTTWVPFAQKVQLNTGLFENLRIDLRMDSYCFNK